MPSHDWGRSDGGGGSMLEIGASVSRFGHVHIFCRKSKGFHDAKQQTGYSDRVLLLAKGVKRWLWEYPGCNDDN